MGISELLPFLKPIEKQRHLSDYRGLRAGVDGYILLHKAVFSCPTQLLTHDPEGYAKVVRYCMTRIRTLLDHGITPVVVFDGAPLPAKAATEEERAKRREKSLLRAFEFQDAGDKSRAFHAFVQAVEVTPFLAWKFQEALEQQKLQFIVAPYEADAQLAFLFNNKSIDLAISEDSDLLTFGCTRVLYKLDIQSGKGVEICLEDVGSKFRALEGDNFKLFCILCGCDYLSALPRVTPKKNFMFMQRCLGHVTIPNLLRMAQMHAIAVPPDFEEKFMNALHTFKHQTVFDPDAQKLVPLTPFAGEIGNISILGEVYDSDLAGEVARGVLCPISKKPFETPLPTSLQSLRPLVLEATGNAEEATIGTPTESVVVLEDSPKPPVKKFKVTGSFLDQFAFGKVRS